MVLVGLLSSLSGLLNLKGKTDIDSPVCKLHHNLTTTILLCFSLLVTATNLIGDPVKCTFRSHPLMKEDFINTYCWIHPTFTFPRDYKLATSIYTGVDVPDRKVEAVYHAYYQWVPFVLFLQALLFYAPYWLWKTWEGGKVQAASAELTALIMKRDDRKEKINMLAEYLHGSLRKHNFYALKYLFTETLNFAVTVANICLINKFLDGKFISYGSNVFSFTQVDDAERTDPMLLVFPRMTKCTFSAYGSSGTKEKLDSLCMLPHNIINEKIYLFLWIWLWILVVADALAVVWRCIVFYVPIIRLHLINKYSQGLNKEQRKSLSKNLQVGDYFLLYLLHKNVSHKSFGDLVRELCARLEEKPSDSLELGEKRGPHNRGPPNMGPPNRGYYNYNMMHDTS